MNQPARSSTMLISEGLALLIPVWLGIYWILYAWNLDVAIALLRPASMGLSIMMALLWFRTPMTRVEKRLLATLALLIVGLLLPSITATDTVRAMQEWIKLILLSSISVLLCRPLRNPRTAKAFGLGLLLASLILALQFIYVYIHHMGYVVPTFRAVRVLKGIAVNEGTPFNMMSFDCIFACLCGMSLLRRSKMLWWYFCIITTIATMLTGSRAQIGALAVCAGLLLVIRAFRSRRMILRIGAIGVTAATALGAGLFLALTPFKEMSEITEGRWDLWWVAWQKFTERPLLGWGYLSWRDDLVSRLPGAYSLTGTIASMVAGGYHNQYITALAEQGLVGFVVFMALCWFLVKSSWKLAYIGPRTNKDGELLLFICMFLLLRANFEMSGLFAYAQGSGDYFAYIFVAILVSRVSIQEEGARLANLQRQWYYRAMGSGRKMNVPANASAFPSNR
jgi:O-antigen ligase